MFTNENSADAVYGSLGEARWSMECDENWKMSFLFGGMKELVI